MLFWKCKSKKWLLSTVTWLLQNIILSYRGGSLQKLSPWVSRTLDMSLLKRYSWSIPYYPPSHHLMSYTFLWILPSKPIWFLFLFPCPHSMALFQVPNIFFLIFAQTNAMLFCLDFWSQVLPYVTIEEKCYNDFFLTF